MSISVNGKSCVPPGFRFHPTEEELLNYYLRKKVASDKIDLDVIREVDLNKLEPWDIQDKCRIGSTPQNDWYFFSHKDKKYPTGTRTNRATVAGFWKATGRDKVIYTSSRKIGMRKTLVFYRGRAPHGQKSDWIMHEYRLHEHSDTNRSCFMEEISAHQEDGWVVCRVFKKKNHHKAMDSPNNSSSMITTDSKTQLIIQSAGDGSLNQILQYMGRSCQQEYSKSIDINSIPNSSLRHHLPMETKLNSSLHEKFMKLPALESPPLPSLHVDIPPAHDHHCSDQTTYLIPMDSMNMDSSSHYESGISDWAALDHLVAAHLNGQSTKLSCFDVDPVSAISSSNMLLVGAHDCHHQPTGDGDLWSLTSSVSGPSIYD